MSEEIKSALDSIQTQVDAALKKVNDQVAESGKATAEARGELKSLLEEHANIAKDLQGVKSDVQDLLQKGVSLESDLRESKSIGAQFIESESFKNFQSGVSQKARVELKNTIVTGGNNSVTDHDKLSGVVAGAFRNLTVMPTLNTGVASSNIVYYSRELLYTNNAASQTEGSAKAESVLTFEEVSTPIRTVAHFLKASKQAPDDSSFLASYIDQRMRHGVLNATENQIINGDGTGVNFDGWLASGNSTATSPLLTTDIFGLANKMKYEVMSADYMPDFYYINPADWATMEATRRGTGDAAFVAASGAISYVNNGMTPLLWGLPVVISNNVPAGTIICKSRDADMYADRQSVVVEMFEQDDTNVQSNLVTIRAELRGASLNFRPTAIRTGAIASIT